MNSKLPAILFFVALSSCVKRKTDTSKAASGFQIEEPTTDQQEHGPTKEYAVYTFNNKKHACLVTRVLNLKGNGIPNFENEYPKSIEDVTKSLRNKQFKNIQNVVSGIFLTPIQTLFLGAAIMENLKVNIQNFFEDNQNNREPSAVTKWIFRYEGLYAFQYITPTSTVSHALRKGKLSPASQPTNRLKDTHVSVLLEVFKNDKIASSSDESCENLVSAIDEEIRPY